MSQRIPEVDINSFYDNENHSISLDCQELTDNHIVSLTQFIKNHPEITKIHLSPKKYSSEVSHVVLADFFDVLNNLNNVNLTGLVISRLSLGNKDVKNIAEMLHGSMITHLELNSCLTSSNLNILSESFRSGCNLRTLSLENDQFDKSNLRFDDSSVQALALALQGAEKLQLLSLGSACEKISDLTFKTLIDLRRKNGVNIYLTDDITDNKKMWEIYDTIRTKKDDAQLKLARKAGITPSLKELSLHAVKKGIHGKKIDINRLNDIPDDLKSSIKDPKK